MSISFACDQCGKSFTLDDKFAGKKGRCKQCGAAIQIPGLAPTAPPSRPVGREGAPARRAPVASPPPAPRDDLYGLDDAPLPPRSAPAALRGDSAGPAPGARPRKKSAGLFASSKKKSQSSGGSSAGSIIVRVVLGVVGAGAGLVATAVVLPAIRSTLVPGWASRSDIDAFIKRQVDLTNDLTAILRTVTDLPSAISASPRANAAVQKLTQNLRSNKDRRGNQKDIDDLKQKYLVQQQQAVVSFTQEIQRVAMIPGAVDALAIEGALRELASIEQQIPGAGGPAGFTPPPMPAPRFTPPPNFNPPPPNFNPPTNMPGPPGRKP